MSPKVRSAWFQLALLVSAIAAMLWIKYRASETLRDFVAYSLILCTVGVVSYYCLRCIQARVQHRIRLGNNLFLARARSPAWFYIGAVGISVGFIVNVILLLYFISDISQLMHQVANALKGGDALQLWFGAALCFFALGSLFMWLGAYQLSIGASTIEYWSLFGGYRSLSLAEIQKAQIKNGWALNRPPLRLEILPTHGSNATNPIIVNVKVFRKEDLERVFDWLGSKMDTSIT